MGTSPRPGVQHLQKGHGIFRYEDREASAVDTYHGRCSDEEEQHVMVVLCPAGKQAGDVVLIETVDGLEVEVEIPPGVNAGDEFEIVI